VVAGEVAGLCGGTVFFEVAGRGDGEDAGVEEPAGDERRGRWRAEADGEVEAFGDEVAEGVAGDEFDGERGEAVEELADAGADEEPGEEGVDVDAEAAFDGGRGTGGGGDGVAESGEERSDLLVEALAFGGELEGAGGAVEKADAKARFETADGAADGGLGDGEGFGGANEGAGLDDGGEGGDTAEDAGVRVHIDDSRS